MNATEAFSYFWGTPEEKTFRFGDIPADGVPEPLRGGPSSPPAVFLEAAAPAVGLAWAMLVDPRGRAGGLSTGEVRAAAAAKGVATTGYVGEPVTLAIEPGLVEHAGALVYAEEGPLDDDTARYYEHLLGPRGAEEVRHILQIIPFAELDYGGGDVVLQLPQLIWYLPVGEDGRVKTVGTDEEAVTLVVPPGQGMATPGGASGDAVARGHRPLKLAVLFALACANAALARKANSPTLEEVGEDAFGPVWRLRLERFGRLLDERCGARTLGLSHALAVCRDEFVLTGGADEHTTGAESSG